MSATFLKNRIVAEVICIISCFQAAMPLSNHKQKFLTWTHQMCRKTSGVKNPKIEKLLIFYCNSLYLEFKLSKQSYSWLLLPYHYKIVLLKDTLKSILDWSPLTVRKNHVFLYMCLRGWRDPCLMLPHTCSAYLHPLTVVSVACQASC